MGPERESRNHVLLGRLADRERWQVFLGLLPGVALAVLFWRTVAIDPLTAPALLLDRLLQVASIGYAVVVPVVLIGAARPALYSALYGSVTGLVMGLSMALTGVLRPPAEWLMVIFATLAAASSAGVLWKFVGRLDWLKSTGAKLATTLLAAAIPLLQFWNSASFLPARTEANLTQTIAVEFEDDTKGTLTYHAANETDGRVLVIISQLIACWWEPDAQASYDLAIIREAPNCRTYRPVAEQAWIAATSDLNWQVTLQAPDSAPKLAVIARIAYARGDRLRLTDTTGPVGDVGPCSNVRPVLLREESRVKGVAQQDKYLVYADLNGDGGTNYYFDAGPTIDCQESPVDDSGLQDYFGVTEGTVIHEAWAGPPNDR